MTRASVLLGHQPLPGHGASSISPTALAARSSLPFSLHAPADPREDVLPSGCLQRAKAPAAASEPVDALSESSVWTKTYLPGRQSQRSVLLTHLANRLRRSTDEFLSVWQRQGSKEGFCESPGKKMAVTLHHFSPASASITRVLSS